jgi:predicted MFS family arabinose efflux permease
VTREGRLNPRGLGGRLVGGEIDPAIRPVLGVAFLQAIAEGAQTSFLGLWALRSLRSSQTELGLAFAAAAIAAIAAGYLAGKLSDRIGRRRPILVASAALVIFGASLAFVGQHVLLGLALMVCLGAAGGTLLTAHQVVLTDLVPRERHEHAFASARVVQNIGFVAGPLIGAGLLWIGWRTLFLGTSAIAALAFVVAIGAIPRQLPFSSEEPGEGSSLRALLRDPSFSVILAAGTLAAMVYISYETLLPISLVQSHGVAPAAWGVLLAINPVAVVLFQIRVTSSAGRLHEFARLAVGIAAMGTPFLLVAVSTALPLLILMLVLFVLGEMLWVPPSQALIARLAPDEKRGAYLGASGAMWPAAFALGPLLGLQVRSALGDTAMWCAVATVGALSIALYGVAERRAERSARPS